MTVACETVSIDSPEFVAEVLRLVDWALFVRWPKRWAMFAGGGSGRDVRQECIAVVWDRIQKRWPIDGVSLSTFIVNNTKWTLFRLIADERKRREALRNYRRTVQQQQYEVDVDSDIDLRIATRRLLLGLTYREREIVKMRFGFGDGCEYTLEETGFVFRVSKGRIFQIESKAIRKLQYHCSRSFRPLFQWIIDEIDDEERRVAMLRKLEEQERQLAMGGAA